MHHTNIKECAIKTNFVFFFKVLIIHETELIHRIKNKNYS